MKIELKKIDAIRRELRFEIPKERVKQKMEEVYSDIGKVAKVKGFRPGKVPRNVLEAQHSSLAREEALKSLIPQAYQEGIEKENLFPIEMPEIHDVSFKDGIITFTAKFDIKPEVKVKDYKGIKVTRKSSAVTDEEINKTLEFFQKGQGEDKKVTVDDNFAKGIGYQNLEEFKKFLRRQMEMDKDRHNKIDLENQIIEELLKKIKVLAPESLVKKQLEHRVQETINRLKSQGVPADNLKGKEEDIRKDLKEPVERDIKVYFILDKIAQEEKMEIKEGENLPAKVIEFLLKEANWEEAK